MGTTALPRQILAPFPEGTLDRPPLGADLVERQRGGTGAGDDDQVDLRWDEPRPEPEALAAKALDPVPLDGVPDLPRHDDSEA